MNKFFYKPENLSLTKAVRLKPIQLNNFFEREEGFSLIEALVVILVLVIFGFLISGLLLRTFRGGNKTELIDIVKQNGQSALTVMDSTIRYSDAVVCVGTWNSWPGLSTQPTDTITVVKKGIYTRFRFYPQTSTANGYLAQDTPTADPTNTNSLCADSLQGGSSQTTGLKYLTDTNTLTGVSVAFLNSTDGFVRTQTPGFKDVVSISFNLAAGASAGNGADRQVSVNGINGINFSTKVEIR